MTAHEYRDATNLAKIRAARAIMADTLPINTKEDDLRTAILRLLWETEELHASRVKIK
jgi:hypothetical protein